MWIIVVAVDEKPVCSLKSIVAARGCVYRASMMGAGEGLGNKTRCPVHLQLIRTTSLIASPKQEVAAPQPLRLCRGNIDSEFASTLSIHSADSHASAPWDSTPVPAAWI